MHPGGRHQASGAGLLAGGQQPCAGAAGGPAQADLGAAQCDHQHTGAHVFTGATGLCRCDVTGPVRRVCNCADAAPPRLFCAASRGGGSGADRPDPTDCHADPPSTATAWGRLGLLVACLVARLVAVVVQAKPIAPAIEAGVRAAGGLPAAVGVIVALLLLLPWKLGCRAGGCPQAAADQPQPGVGLNPGQHRFDHPRRGGAALVPHPAAGAGPAANGHRAAGADLCRRPPDPGQWLRQIAARRAAAGAVRQVPVSGRGVLLAA